MDETPGASADDNASLLLKGQVALITGGARGIGFEIARAFAKEGAKIILNDLGCDAAGVGADPEIVEEAAKVLRSEGAEVTTSAADVGDEESVLALFKMVESAHGPVEILVNNAGITQDKSLFDLSLEGWDSVMRTHLRGSFLCTQSMARALRKAKRGGAIINMCSTSGMLGNLGQINESSAKAGIYGLTRTSSIELQKFNIRVNALAAIAKTRLTAHLPMFEKVEGTMDARHIAPAAVFLASALSDDLSGTVLSVAGGRISTFELAESQGRLKEGDEGIWTPQQIAENYDSISRR
jgi:NAD(P)-dependent dehydrogenase (short-subunit alcohol dehydrogenase family)